MGLQEKKAHVAASVREAATTGHRPHTCHAKGCGKQVPPAFFMCGRHWKMVPYKLQQAVWREYNAGQEDGNADVSEMYLKVTDEAVAYVAKLEGK